MSTRSSRPRSRVRSHSLQKPNGKLTSRVQAVGPQHFGIVCLDGAKHRSRWMLADFYGNVLLPPATLHHNQGDFQNAFAQIRQAQQQHHLHDLLVVLERTGQYHRPVQLAFRQAGFETRLVHSFASRQLRQPADPYNKTDDTDLAAIHRAAVLGFGLIELPWPADYQQLQLLVRQRRDLVRKASILRCQILEKLHDAMPGYATCFGDHFWDSLVALPVALSTGSASAVIQTGLAGLQQIVDQQNIRARTSTLTTILAWAKQAPPGHPHPQLLGRLLRELEEDRQLKVNHIKHLEQDMAHLLVGMPYGLLMVIPGINVTSAAELAAEMGPIAHYANAEAITGRAGLMPSRYQSDTVDCPHGPLRRCGNRRLRFALLQIADNLIVNNAYFRAKAKLWKKQGKSSGWIHVKVAKSFSRLGYAMVASGQIFAHDCCQERHYLLAKLLAFHQEHQTDLRSRQRDLERMVEQLPRGALSGERQSLQEELERLGRRRSGPVELGEIVSLVLAKLGGRLLESSEGE